MKQFLITLLLAHCWFLSKSQSENELIAEASKVAYGKTELIKVIEYFKQRQNKEMLKAACFLIKNINIHHTASYLLLDTTGRQISFDELSFKVYDSAIAAFRKIQDKNSKVNIVSVRYKDIDNIKAEYLIRNIEAAFNSAIRGKQDINIFQEYILPYRITVEPVQEWRESYSKRFSYLKQVKVADSIETYIKLLVDDINDWFTCVYGIEKGQEYLPRLGSQQLLFRKKGFCEDVADLATFALRANGIGAAVDVVPYWATSTGTHTLNTLFWGNKYHHFDVLFDSAVITKLVREPGKVYRITYSKQMSALASLIDTSKIPKGLLRLQNITDVTHEYWDTVNLELKLKNILTGNTPVYLAVMNGGSWQAITGRLSVNNRVFFDALGTGAVYLPVLYKRGSLIPVEYPLLVKGNKKRLLLKPDFKRLRNIVLSEQEGFLIFQKDKNYRLFFWNGLKWKIIGIEKAVEGVHQISFNNVPANALLLLLPEQAKRKERPFIIDESGRRFWY